MFTFILWTAGSGLHLFDRRGRRHDRESLERHGEDVDLESLQSSGFSFAFLQPEIEPRHVHNGPRASASRNVQDE